MTRSSSGHEMIEVVTDSPFLTEDMLGADTMNENAEESSALFSQRRITDSRRMSIKEVIVNKFSFFSNRNDSSAIVNTWRSDFAAGLTVGVVLVPQGLAYGMLAGLDPAYGLYCGVAPLFVYGLLGESRFLAIGPFALVSLLTFEAAKNASDIVDCDISPESGCFVSAALTLSCLTGIAQVILAATGAAEIVAALLADAIIEGFTTAAACLIASSQLRHFVGLDDDAWKKAQAKALERFPTVCRSSDLLKTWLSVINAASNWSWCTIAIASICTALLIAFKRLKRRFNQRKFPEQLVVIVLATIVTFAFNIPVPIVGKLPTGPPPIYLQPWRRILSEGKGNEESVLLRLVQSAVTLAVVAYALSLAISRSLSAKIKSKDTSSPRRELAAMGVANVIGGFFSAYPAAGSLSRSALAVDAGAETVRHNLIAASIVLLTLLALTPLFKSTPKAVLSAVVFVSLLSLFDPEPPKRLWEQKQKRDALFWGFALLVTLILGVETGLASAIAISLLGLIYDAARPFYAQLGRVQGHPEVYRDLDRRFHAPRYPAHKVPGVIVFRYGTAIHFLNRSHFVKAVLSTTESDTFKYIQEYEQESTVHCVVLDCSAIAYLDSSAETLVADLVLTLKSKGITLLFSCARGPLRDILNSSPKLKPLIPTIFVSLHDAVAFAETRLVSTRSATSPASLDNQNNADNDDDDEPHTPRTSFTMTMSNHNTSGGGSIVRDDQEHGTASTELVEINTQPPTSYITLPSTPEK